MPLHCLSPILPNRSFEFAVDCVIHQSICLFTLSSTFPPSNLSSLPSSSFFSPSFFSLYLHLPLPVPLLVFQATKWTDLAVTFLLENQFILRTSDGTLEPSQLGKATTASGIHNSEHLM